MVLVYCGDRKRYPWPGDGSIHNRILWQREPPAARELHTCLSNLFNVSVRFGRTGPRKDFDIAILIQARNTLDAMDRMGHVTGTRRWHKVTGITQATRTGFAPNCWLRCAERIPQIPAMVENESALGWLVENGIAIPYQKTTQAMQNGKDY